MLRVVAGLDVATTAKVLSKRAGAVRIATMRGLRRLAAHPQVQALPPGAVEALRQGRVEQARTLLELLVAQAPELPELHANLGAVLRDMASRRLPAAIADRPKDGFPTWGHVHMRIDEAGQGQHLSDMLVEPTAIVVGNRPVDTQIDFVDDHSVTRLSIMLVATPNASSVA